MQLAIYAGLRDTGVLERLVPETRKVVETSVHGIPFIPADNEALLEQALLLIPEGKRPPGLHRTIASKLLISNSDAWKVLEYLEKSGRIASNTEQPGN